MMNIAQVVQEAEGILNVYADEAALLCRDMLGNIEDPSYTSEAKMLACAALLVPLLRAHAGGLEHALTLHGALIGHFIAHGATHAGN